ncbi:MAG: [FeFe] hydrogenase H-cluster radical SAM maturase HydE [Planctomycetes bacterium]|nr:[FeFe] hydrogenase H-cluster radical SAM maturase HydE [Planctomycetota bacterium]MBU4400214.1 [FeFe] hydrogenase H-cluster radical SAM maturase HydE [Planctomycetota bacterium]MCG2684524.1 [FeFe] hydrogenase H-cluster radical SAM maturase HydE [Planctomycetales bacterium]
MQRSEIINWLRETDPGRLEDLWRPADRTRRENVGDEVHLRGLVELSNHCVRLCGYCGLRAANTGLQRYRMSDDEVLRCAHQAVEFGYGTVVLQSGEDPQLTGRRMTGLIRRIKAETPLAVTLSLGERDDDELAEWRRAGADRYLLRFETSNRELYDRIHPPKADVPSAAKRSRWGGSSTATPTGDVPHSRFAILHTLRELGYEVGSGVMIGIPGQTFDDLADDIELFGRLDLDMIGVGPYLRHPDTPLADRRAWPDAPAGRQVPADETMTYKVIALTRLVCPRTNIPATTALATLNTDYGRELGLVRGANVVMPNLTPPKYRILYEIYPDKACIAETGRECHRCLIARIKALGRRPGAGRGDSPSYHQRLAADGTSPVGVAVELPPQREKMIV